MVQTKTASPRGAALGAWPRRLWVDLRKNHEIYLLLLPALVYYVLFCYKPMYGVIIAFKNFVPVKGILGSPWAGFKHFEAFFGSYYFVRLLTNTLTISIGSLIFGFPAPLIFALMLNEITNLRYKRVIQTVTYMPHFISMVVICALIKLFTADTGIIVQFMSWFGFTPISLLSKSRYFVPVYIISGIWQQLGWSSIIYLSALTAIDPGLYEAATIDGAGRWKKMLHVTLPGMAPTIIILLILRMGSIMNVGFEKIILLYNEGIYDTADVISTFVYRKGLQQFQWSYSSAVGLFNSVINFVIVVTVNFISGRVSQTSLW